VRRLKCRIAATDILNLGKNDNNSRLDKGIILHQIIWEGASRPCGDDHVTKSRNWQLIRVISVSITNIWTKFDIELKHHTISITECAKFTWLENPRWRRPPSWISKNVNNSNGTELFAQNLMGRCITAMRRWHMAKTPNRKFIRVTSLNECRENRCDDVEAYKSSQLTDLYFKPCRTQMFALLSRLLISDGSPIPTNFIKTANII